MAFKKTFSPSFLIYNIIMKRYTMKKRPHRFVRRKKLSKRASRRNFASGARSHHHNRHMARGGFHF